MTSYAVFYDITITFSWLDDLHFRRHSKAGTKAKREYLENVCGKKTWNLALLGL